MNPAEVRQRHIASLCDQLEGLASSLPLRALLNGQYTLELRWVPTKDWRARTSVQSSHAVCNEIYEVGKLSCHVDFISSIDLKFSIQ